MHTLKFLVKFSLHHIISIISYLWSWIWFIKIPPNLRFTSANSSAASTSCVIIKRKVSRHFLDSCGGRRNWRAERRRKEKKKTQKKQIALSQLYPYTSIVVYNLYTYTITCWGFSHRQRLEYFLEVKKICDVENSDDCKDPYENESLKIPA